MSGDLLTLLPGVKCSGEVVQDLKGEHIKRFFNFFARRCSPLSPPAAFLDSQSNKFHSNSYVF